MISKNWFAVLASERVNACAYTGLSFVVDCVITVTLSILLHRSKTEYAE
jgi:hypothetical protein